MSSFKKILKMVLIIVAVIVIVVAIVAAVAFAAGLSGVGIALGETMIGTITSTLSTVFGSMTTWMLILSGASAIAGRVDAVDPRKAQRQMEQEMDKARNDITDHYNAVKENQLNSWDGVSMGYYDDDAYEVGVSNDKPAGYTPPDWTGDGGSHSPTKSIRDYIPHIVVGSLVLMIVSD